MITKHRTIMRTAASATEHAKLDATELATCQIKFSNHAVDDDPSSVDSELFLAAGVWLAMGAPSTITMSAEAGDHLNHVKSGDKFEGRRAEQRARIARDTQREAS